MFEIDWGSVFRSALRGGAIGGTVAIAYLLFQVRTRTCPRCGARTEPRAKVCRECGRPLDI